MLIRIGSMSSSTSATGEGASSDTGGGGVDVVQLSGASGGLRLAAAVGFIKLAGT